jgi:hypothetical protein
VETHRDVLRPTCRLHAGLKLMEGNPDIIHRDRFPDALKTHFCRIPATSPPAPHGSRHTLHRRAGDHDGDPNVGSAIASPGVIGNTICCAVS